MATVNFSVPDEVRDAFDATFRDQNKSAIVAELMRRAVRDHELLERRRQLFRRLSKVARAPATSSGVRKARVAGRP